MVLTQSQDKSLRRLSELKEQLMLEQAAKRDVEQNYQLMLEEKNEQIKVCQLQVMFNFIYSISCNTLVNYSFLYQHMKTYCV